MKISTVVFFFTTIISVSFGQGIKLDGMISTGEWTGASEHDLGSGNKLLLKIENETIYVALSSSEQFWAHVYLYDGKTVDVMHASAALGKIKYTNSGESWTTTDSAFTYEMRDRTFNPTTEEKQKEYYKNHGWVANNSNMGDKKTIEFKLDRTKLNKNSSLACVLINHQMKMSNFPTTLQDDTVLPRLVQGYAVESVKFNPQSWYKVLGNR